MNGATDQVPLQQNPNVQEFAAIPDNPEYWELVKATQPLMAKLVRICCKIMGKEVD